MAEPDPIVTRDAEGPPTEEEARDQEIANAETPEQREEAAALEPSAPVIDQAIAQPAPVVGSATENTAATPQVPQTPQDAGAGAFNAGMAAANAAEDKGAAATEESDIARQRLEQQRQDAEDERVRRQMDDVAAEDARNEFNGRLTAAQEKVRGFKFHDYFSNPEHQSKALARLSVFLGGLANLGGQAPGAPNRALDHLEDDIRRDHDDQLAYLNSAKYFADKQREGYGDLLKQQAVDRREAALNYANKKIATADQFEALAQSARGKANRDAAIEAANKLRMSAYDDQQKVFAEIHREKMDDARAAYLLSKAHKGGVGAGAGDVASKVAAYLKANPGDEAGALAVAEKGGVHGQKAAALVGSISTTANKKPAGGIDASKVVRDLDGTPLGGAPSGRGGAAALQSDLRTNQQALDQLITLRKKNKTLAIGPEFDDAVVALAAVTSAGKTDTNTEHEKGAITNFTHKIISSEGLDNKIEQIRKRIEQIKAQLTPLPEGYTEERGNKEEKPANAAVEQAQKRLQSLGAVRIE